MIRLASPSDLDAIGAVCDAAFAPSRFESELVRRLPSGREEFHPWVAEEDGRIVAVAVYSPARRERQVVGFHLAPVAVLPDYQRRGIGTALLRHSLAVEPVARQPVFVLGDPVFYERFGFRPVHSARCAFEPTHMHFRALRWSEVPEPFYLGYPAAFHLAGNAEPGVGLSLDHFLPSAREEQLLRVIAELKPDLDQRDRLRALFVLTCVNHAVAFAGIREHISGLEFIEATPVAALEIFGEDPRAWLRSLGLDSTRALGEAVFQCVAWKIIGAREQDLPAEFEIGPTVFDDFMQELHTAEPNAEE